MNIQFQPHCVNVRTALCKLPNPLIEIVYVYNTFLLAHLSTNWHWISTGVNLLPQKPNHIEQDLYLAGASIKAYPIMIFDYDETNHPTGVKTSYCGKQNK